MNLRSEKMSIEKYFCYITQHTVRETKSDVVKKQDHVLIRV